MSAGVLFCFNLEVVTEDEHNKHVFGKEVLNKSSVLKCDVS
jgi:ribosomal protein S8E